MGQGVPVGLLQLLALTAVLVCVTGAAVYWRELARLARTVARRFHVTHPPAPAPGGRPIEAITADLRRLRCQAQHPAAGTPQAQREGGRRAYDDVLAEACRALGIENLLDQVPPGTERDAERLRTEYLLEQAGLRISEDPAA